MSEHDRGQVDVAGAEVYDELFVPALFGRFAEQVADLAGLGPDDRVIDVACGTGALTRPLAERTAGEVVGVDINPGMLEVAKRHGGRIDYRQGDAAALPVEADSFEVATCQFGLMFFPDPAAAVAEMRRVAGRGLVAVWGEIERSAGYTAMQELFRHELGHDAASSLDAPFAMGRPGVVEAILDRAGLPEPTVVEISGTGRFDSIEQWVTTEVRGWTLGDSVGDERLAELVSVAEDRLAPFVTDDGAVFGMGAKVWTWSG